MLSPFLSISAAFKTRLKISRLYAFGGVDGTRTRDPRRDRPVF